MQRQGTNGFRFAIAASCAMAALAVTPPGASQGLEDQGIEVLGTRDMRPPADPKAAVPAPSERAGVVIDAAPTVTLGPVDVAALLAEDRLDAQFGSKARRVSVGRDVLVRLRDGQWHEVAGGNLWVVEIVAREAVGLRLHFTGVDLPDGAELVVYGFELGLPMQGPYAGHGLLGDGAFWTGSVLGERARIEYFVPAGAGGGNPQVPFAVDSLQHVYVDFYRGGGGGSGAGPCHNDPNCFPAWEDVADSVGRIFIASTGLLCSGQLLNTVISDDTPYYLTAFHCISTGSEASSAEVMWRYETVSCGGGPTFGPVSQVCSIVDTYSPADETLLMVEGTLPTGLFWSGWQSSPPASGTASAGIHHPDGDYKRISFGFKTNTPNCGGPSTNYTRANWTDGVTEPGSSGSGLWRDSNQLLFGTMTCGVSSCGNPAGDDSYGRFDRSYGVGGFSSSLLQGSDDANENNDSCATAPTLPVGTFLNQVVKSTDEDWYVVTLPTFGSLTIDLTFTHSFGDIDVELYDACGGNVVASSVTNTNNEAISFANFGTGADLYVRIFLDTDTRNTYTMTTSVGLVNDDCSSASVLVAGLYRISNTTATTDGPDEPADCNFDGYSQIGSDVWFRYFAQCTGQATVSLCGSGYNTKLAVYGANCPTGSGEVIVCNNDFCGQQSEVTFAVTENTFYRIRSGGHFGAQGNGTMTITCTPDVLPCPEDINEDGTVNVLDLIDLLLCFGQPAIPGCEAEDINEDGTVNVLDLIALLLAFGSACP